MKAYARVPLHEELRIEASLWSDVPFIGKLSIRLARMADEVEVMQRQLVDVAEQLALQAALTKALLPYQERAVIAEAKLAAIASETQDEPRYELTEAGRALLDGAK